jgi:hypothetical protein
MLGCRYRNGDVLFRVFTNENEEKRNAKKRGNEHNRLLNVKKRKGQNYWENNNK